MLPAKTVDTIVNFGLLAVVIVMIIPVTGILNDASKEKWSTWGFVSSAAIVGTALILRQFFRNPEEIDRRKLAFEMADENAGTCTLRDKAQPDNYNELDCYENNGTWTPSE